MTTCGAELLKGQHRGDVGRVIQERVKGCAKVLLDRLAIQAIGGCKPVVEAALSQAIQQHCCIVRQCLHLLASTGLQKHCKGQVGIPAREVNGRAGLRGASLAGEQCVALLVERNLLEEGQDLSTEVGLPGSIGDRAPHLKVVVEAVAKHSCRFQVIREVLQMLTISVAQSVCREPRRPCVTELPGFDF